MNIISWTLSILLLLKTIELLIQSIITSSFNEFGNKELKKCFLISRFINKVRIGKLFRLPILIIFSSIVNYFQQHLSNLTLTFSTITIFITLWLQLLQSFFIRFNLGETDQFLRYFIYDFSWKNSTQELPKINKRLSVRHILIFIIGLVFVTIIGYSSIYLTVSNLELKSFHGINNSIINSLYFSTVSFTTVGYGDIYPTADFSKLIVMSEIVYSFGVLVMLVLSYSMTANDK